MHVAAEYSNIECVKILKEYGADTEICDKNNQKPEDLALDFRMSDAFMDCKGVYLTSKSEDITELESMPQTYELFNTFGENLQNMLKESLKTEKPLLMEWLNSINLGNLYGVMVDSGYDDHNAMSRQMLTSMPITEKNLSEIGVLKPGNRKKLLFYLEEEAKRKIFKPKESNFGVSVPTIRD